MSYNNLPAGGMVGGSMMIYVDDEELAEIKALARRRKIRIESIEAKEPKLFSDVVKQFAMCGAPD